MTETTDMFDGLARGATRLPERRETKPASHEPPVEPAFIEPGSAEAAALQIVGRCLRCGQVQYGFSPTPCNLCCECAALQVIRDPQPTYPAEVWNAAIKMARYSSAQQIVWRLGVDLEDALRFRRRVLRP